MCIRDSGLSSGYGFDSIALALIGNNHPLGVILTSLLFGTLRNGATKMMVVSSIPIDIVEDVYKRQGTYRLAFSKKWRSSNFFTAMLRY